jgi:hypothetical protein
MRGLTGRRAPKRPSVPRSYGLLSRQQTRFFELRDGDDLSGIVLELVPPPGLARTVDIRSHHDIVDRVVVGKDRWGHPDMNGKLHLAFDPLDVQAAPPEQQNTWSATTPSPNARPER